MKFTLSSFSDRFAPFLAEIIYSDQFDKYVHFFDKLISVHKVSVNRYEETDTFIEQLAEHLDDLPYAIELLCSQPCEIIFDFYYRYHILMELIETMPLVRVEADCEKGLFKELFIKVWITGISTFSRKNF